MKQEIAKVKTTKGEIGECVGHPRAGDCVQVYIAHNGGRPQIALRQVECVIEQKTIDVLLEATETMKELRHQACLRIMADIEAGDVRGAYYECRAWQNWVRMWEEQFSEFYDYVPF
jgi:hypothetical protein